MKEKFFLKIEGTTNEILIDADYITVIKEEDILLEKWVAKYVILTSLNGESYEGYSLLSDKHHIMNWLTSKNFRELARAYSWVLYSLEEIEDRIASETENEPQGDIQDESSK